MKNIIYLAVTLLATRLWAMQPSDDIKLLCINTADNSDLIVEFNEGLQIVVFNTQPIKARINTQDVLFTLGKEGVFIDGHINRSTGMLRLLTRDKRFYENYQCSIYKRKF